MLHNSWDLARCIFGMVGRGHFMNLASTVRTKERKEDTVKEKKGNLSPCCCNKTPQTVIYK